ncbi:MAG TPA: GNAT family N-acetyltransferase, partial [Terracidiphilus sp.]|nr:GNAT family N-acetyltransferase [Terracidiphilus sp.]
MEEYYESIDVVKRDDVRALRRILREPHGALWVASLDGKPMGCVMLRALPQRAEAAECKRLYVRPEARGHGIANALMDEVEAYVRGERLRWLYLDTFEGLKAAVALYRKRGYVSCARYNDNPQATLFMRKRL